MRRQRRGRRERRAAWRGAIFDDGVALGVCRGLRSASCSAARPRRGPPPSRMAGRPGGRSPDSGGANRYCGKTTLLNDPLRHAPGPGIVRVEFDKAPLEETQGAFLAVLFGALLTKALALKCSLEGLGLALSDFGSVGRRGWQGLRELLLVAPESVAKAARVRAAYGILDRTSSRRKRPASS